MTIYEFIADLQAQLELEPEMWASEARGFFAQDRMRVLAGWLSEALQVLSNSGWERMRGINDATIRSLLTDSLPGLK